MSTIFQRVVTTIGELFNKYKDNDVVQAKEYNANYDSIKDVVNNNAEATKELQNAVKDLTEGTVPDYSISNAKLQAACVSYDNLNANLINDVLMHKNNINSMLNPFAEGLYRYTTVSGNLYNSYIYRTLNEPSNIKNVTYTYETADNVVVGTYFKYLYATYYANNQIYRFDNGEINISYESNPFILHADFPSGGYEGIKQVTNFNATYNIEYTLNKEITGFTLNLPQETERIQRMLYQKYQTGSAELTFSDGSVATTDYQYTTAIVKTLTKVKITYNCSLGDRDGDYSCGRQNKITIPSPTFTLREPINVSTTTIGPCSLSNTKNRLKVIYKLKKNEGAVEELSNTPGVISYTTSKYNEVTSVWEPYTYTATNYTYEAAPDEDGHKVCYYTAYLELPSGTNFPDTITLDYTNDNLVTLLTCLISALDGPQTYSGVIDDDIIKDPDIPPVELD